MMKINLLAEKWRPIVEFPDYAISNMGRVMRLSPARRTYSGRILKPYKGTANYLLVSFRKFGIGKRYFRTIHRIVAHTFLGPCPADKEVNHKNGKKTDNRLANLEYLTPQENHAHAAAMGLKRAPRGSDNWQAKLTEKDILKIVELRSLGWHLAHIAKRFKVSISLISNIVAGRNWNWFTKIKP